MISLFAPNQASRRANVPSVPIPKFAARCGSFQANFGIDPDTSGMFRVCFLDWTFLCERRAKL